MSGQQAFIQLNQVALGISGSPIPKESPPIADLSVGIQNLTLAKPVVAGKIEVDWSILGTGIAADYIQEDVAGPFSSPGRIEVVGKFTRLTAVAGNLLTADITGLEAGAWYFIRLRYVQADGQVSPWVQNQCQAGVAP